MLQQQKIVGHVGALVSAIYEDLLYLLQQTSYMKKQC
jgi:hypothetical protein